MLSTQMVGMLITSGVVGGALGAMLIGFPFLTKKGVDVPKVLDTAEEVLDVAGPAINLVAKIAPNSKIVNIADFIEKWARTGVKNAQQLYYSSQLTNNQDRKTVAKETVYAALKELNIETTENQKKLIDDTIEAAVNDLGHKDKTEAEKQAALEKVQSEKAQLAAENSQLRQAITQFNATTANTVQATIQTA